MHGVAGGTGVLARHAAGFRPLLEEASLVDDEDPGGLVPEMPDDVGPEGVADTVRRPSGGSLDATGRQELQEVIDGLVEAAKDAAS